MDDTPDHTEDDKYKFGLANSTSSSSPKTCSKSPEKVVPVFSTTELKSNSPKEGNTIVLDVDNTSKVKEQLNSKGTIHVEKVYVGCSPKNHSQTPPKANTNTNKEDFLSREDLGSATRELKKDNIKSHTKDCSCNPCKKGRKRAELGLKDVKCKDKGKVRKSKVHQKGKRSSRIRRGSFQGKETKCKKLNNGKIGKIWDAVDVSWCYQEAKGLSGGILILWKESSFLVSHVLKSRYWVAIKGSCTASKEKVLLINVYGPHQDGRRSINWSQLCRLVLSWNGPCCVMGDFNITRYDHERRRQGHHRRSQEIFDKFIIKSNMMDLPLLGKKFTWSGKDGKCSRIDRCCVSGHLDLSCLDIDLSDHNAIRLGPEVRNWGIAPFRFQNQWANTSDFFKMCEEQWSLMTVVGSSLEKVMHKFRRLKIFLKKWSKEKFWNVESELSACKMLIQSIEEAPLWDLDLEQKLFDLKLKKAKLDRDLEIKWRQRARISCLKHNLCPDLNLSNLSLNQISDASNQFLSQSFSRDEIKAALDQIDGSKAPGPDGFNFFFIKRAWFFLEVEIVQIFQDFFDDATIPEEKDQSEKWTDYRPISLINCAYKLLSKVLANRIRKVLPDEENQCAFVEGRFILDGVMTVSELISDLKLNRSMGLILIDFAKAFDSEMATWKSILEQFGDASGLKLNWDKCQLFGINVSLDELSSRAGIINCKADVLPMSYLGFPIGSKGAKSKLWDVVIQKIKQRLAGWKRKTLSIGSRLSKVSNPIVAGGLGVTPLKFKNIALLSKWIWKLYIPKSELDDIGSLCCGPNMWKWEIGDGSNIRFWEDCWAFSDLIRHKFPHLFLACSNKQGKININDKLIWLGNSDGIFKVHDAIKCLSSGLGGPQGRWIDFFWKSFAPPKVKIFMWTIKMNGVPTKEFLKIRGVKFKDYDADCNWCDHQETIDHLFFHCDWSWAIWQAIFDWLHCSWQCFGLYGNQGTNFLLKTTSYVGNQLFFLQSQKVAIGS
ncbi:hypothetical protein CTI12_AA087500 [Artemisia annua]|uniref:RNA-directed DNA polymerase, eukaryota, Reverse transcriptase zinc-binding domain protein n=1 Tax=Artemisia annua TaxID=35608 RepID=A0A2U1PSC9_ARTAN|nr:hypothetical protein CTI12_AA087500 [Artemisia annua]